MARESHAFYVDLAERLGVAVAAGLDHAGTSSSPIPTRRWRSWPRTWPCSKRWACRRSCSLGASHSRSCRPYAVTASSGAAFCAEDGYFDRPQAVVEAFAEAARARGARARAGRGNRRHARRSRLATRHEDRCIDLGRADRGRRRRQPGAPRAARLRPAAGQRGAAPLPQRAARSGVARQPRDCGRPRSRRKATRRRPPARERPDARPGIPSVGQGRWRARIAEQLASLLPALDVPLPTMRSGVYDLTPDRQAGDRPARRRAVGGGGLQRPRVHDRAEQRAGSSPERSPATRSPSGARPSPGSGSRASSAERESQVI